MRNRKFDFKTAYIDLLLNVLMGMVAMFIVATVLINPTKKNTIEGIKKEAELIITADWDPKLDCDVDLWVQGPDQKIVNFLHKNIEVMHLERDDLGFANDRLSNGDVDPNQINQETWVLRGKAYGTYTANVHLYNCKINNVRLVVGDKVNVPVTVSLVKINPDYKNIKTKIVNLGADWEEQTVFSFDYEKDESIDNFKEDYVQMAVNQ